ncbi:gluconokinase isoform X2 [Cryptomeria japonica]|uniref:gluconokinase isoform X2 n=1 Tax=Cryptomeria japonica TaxID=3369 RepID=UPI0025AD6D89|nr:gluconokinase isoform X2 [Cryptomeria japonica]XP_057826321.1 gluconokinase isoform X2 [Cryptomeria japonica]
MQMTFTLLKIKMHNGTPLTDEDRIPWLEAVRDAMIDYIIKDKIVVVACSALQPKYREILLLADPEYALDSYDSNKKTKPISFSSNGGRQHAKSLFSRKVVFMCLQASAQLIASRLDIREKQGAHFMSPNLLQSQIDLLRIDDTEDIFLLDATLSPELITKNIQRKLSEFQLLS